MLHTIVSLLDNSAHIDSYVAHTTVASGMAGCPYSYTASNKCPVPVKGLDETRFSMHIYCRGFELSDTLVHMHVLIVTMHT